MHKLNCLQIKLSTDYDSLNPGHIILREQVLLQPFKVIIGPVHVVFPRPRQLEQAGETTTERSLFRYQNSDENQLIHLAKHRSTLDLLLVTHAGNYKDISNFLTF